MVETADLCFTKAKKSPQTNLTYILSLGFKKPENK